MAGELLPPPASRAGADLVVREGKAAGVTGTPTIFINGRKSASTRIPALEEMIDAALGKKEK